MLEPNIQIREAVDCMRRWRKNCGKWASKIWEPVSAVPEVEDEYLTCDSVHFHEHLGFRMVGEFYKCGFKFGRWYNMAWMEKHIGEHGAQPKVTWKGEM